MEELSVEDVARFWFGRWYFSDGKQWKKVKLARHMKWNIIIELHSMIIGNS